MPERGEGEQSRTKGNGAQKCLEPFTNRDYLERLPRDRTYPLERQFLYCKLHTTWSEAQGAQRGFQCCKLICSSRESFIVASPQRTQEVPSSFFPFSVSMQNSGASFFSKEWWSFTAPHWYHTVLIQTLRNEAPALYSSDMITQNLLISYLLEKPQICLDRQKNPIKLGG